MSKKLGIISIILAVIALGLSLYHLVNPVKQDVGELQYVIYLGTNDKDSYEPFGTPEEAKAKVDGVLSEHFEGFTIQDANGGWTNEDGTVDHEYTVVILLSDTTSEKVHAAADQLIREFNQSSVLIQTTAVKSEFYYGGK